MNTAIAVRPSLDLQPKQIELVKRTIAADCSPAEFDLYMQAAQAYGLDPFRRQILPLVFSKDNAKKRRMSIVVSRDGLRVIASRCRNYRPASEPAVWEIDPALVGPLNPKGLVHCTIYLWQQDNRGDWFKVKGEADWDEFAPVVEEWAENDAGLRRPTGEKTLDAKGNWARMPKVMLEKCAEAQALRAGWPEQFGGLHVEEEMDRARVLDLTASEIVEAEQAERRLNAIGGVNALTIDWLDEEPLERVPVGGFADRVIGWMSGKTADKIIAFQQRNVDALREFWARSKNDALELKKQMEAAVRERNAQPAAA